MFCEGAIVACCAGITRATGGEGDLGTEGLSEMKPEPGDWRTLTLGGPSGPTEDWGTNGLFRTLRGSSGLAAAVEIVAMES